MDYDFERLVISLELNQGDDLSSEKAGITGLWDSSVQSRRGFTSGGKRILS
jgi:hypothetical protein